MRFDHRGFLRSADAPQCSIVHEMDNSNFTRVAACLVKAGLAGKPETDTFIFQRGSAVGSGAHRDAARHEVQLRLNGGNFRHAETRLDCRFAGRCTRAPCQPPIPFVLDIGHSSPSICSLSEAPGANLASRRTINRLSSPLWIPFARRRISQDSFAPHRSPTWKKSG
jgi:hypothetical protein